MTFRSGAQRVIAVLLCVAGLAGLTSVAAPSAYAAPTPLAADVPDVPADDLEDWPQHLRQFIAGSAEFKARYLAPSRQAYQDPVVEGAPSPVGQSCADRGGDVGLYTVDFVRQFGDIVEALGNLPGQEPLGFVTTPWPGAPANELTGSADEHGRIPFSGRGNGYNFDGEDADFARLPDPAYLKSCAADLAPYGQPDASSPWGFTFYDAPDQGSYEAMVDALEQVPAGTTAGGNGIRNGLDSWRYFDDNFADVLDYSPTRVWDYCVSGDEANPLCMTAMFLHCPNLPDPGDTDYQAVSDCQRFNANTIYMNVALVNWLWINGPDGRFHDWVGVLNYGSSWPTVRKWILVGLVIAGGLYVGAATGLLAAGGLRTVLLGTGAAAVLTATDSWDEVWGAVTCVGDIGKCLAKAAAQGMAQATDLVSTTAANQTFPSLTGASGTLNGLAGVSGMIMLILLLLTLVGAVLTGRMGRLIPAAMGAVRWAIAIGAGSAILTLALRASIDASDAIAGAGGSSSATIASWASDMTVGLRDMGTSSMVGWLLVALLCIVGALCAVFVWVVLSMSYQFIPLAVGLMIIQVSGFTGSETTQKWINRGWGMLWTILLLRPTITLVSKFALLTAENATFAGFVGGVVLLMVCALAPWLVVAMFPTVAMGGLGIMKGLLNAAQMADSTGRSIENAGKAGQAIGNRAQQLGRLLGLSSPSPAVAGAQGAPGGGGGTSGGQTDGQGGGSGTGRRAGIGGIGDGGSGRPTGGDQPGRPGSSTVGSADPAQAGRAEPGRPGGPDQGGRPDQEQGPGGADDVGPQAGGSPGEQSGRTAPVRSPWSPGGGVLTPDPSTGTGEGGSTSGPDGGGRSTTPAEASGRSQRVPGRHTSSPGQQPGTPGSHPRSSGSQPGETGGESGSAPRDSGALGGSPGSRPLPTAPVPPGRPDGSGPVQPGGPGPGSTPPSPAGANPPAGGAPSPTPPQVPGNPVPGSQTRGTGGGADRPGEPPVEPGRADEGVWGEGPSGPAPPVPPSSEPRGQGRRRGPRPPAGPDSTGRGSDGHE